MEAIVNFAQQSLLGYLVVINALSFLLFGADKLRAKEQKWRIPEKTLLLSALLGGSVGALAGMRVFHHKTLHPRFQYGIPAMLVLQLAVAGWLIAKGQ